MSSSEHSALEHIEEHEDVAQELSDDSDLDENAADDDTDILGEEDYGWPDKDTMKLIELYRERPQLYDTTHKWYYNRDKKTGTLELLASEMDCSGKCVLCCLNHCDGS